MLEPRDIRDVLKKNIVEVRFTKKDGTERVMICTLLDELLPSWGEQLVTAGDRDSKIITVWDLEYDGWRSFSVDSVLSFEAEPMED